MFIYGTQNSLLYHKQAISYCMPQTLQPWDKDEYKGNPTRSLAVNKLLGVIKKMEIRKEGKESSADRAFEPEEFAAVIHMLANNMDANRLERVLYPLMFIFAYHMIAWLDGVSELKKSWLKAHSVIVFCLLARLPWSKTCTNRREALFQVVVGGDDWKLDVLL